MVSEKVYEFNLFKEELEELGQERKNLNIENKRLEKKSTILTNQQKEDQRIRSKENSKLGKQQKKT